VPGGLGAYRRARLPAAVDTTEVLCALQHSGPSAGPFREGGGGASLEVGRPRQWTKRVNSGRRADEWFAGRGGGGARLNGGHRSKFVGGLPISY